MKAKTVMNKIIIVGGLSACLLLGGCGAGQAADATSAESTVAAQESTVTLTESTEAAETVSTETTQNEAQLPDGVYTAEFSTDSSMFHVSEACDGKGTLTVKDGVMTIHSFLRFQEDPESLSGSGGRCSQRWRSVITAHHGYRDLQ